MTRPRRARPKTTLAAATIALLATIGILRHEIDHPATATASTLRHVTIGVGHPAPDISLLWLMLPKALGYWTQEGFDVDVVGGSGSSQVIQQLVAGQVQFGEINANLLIQGRAEQNIPMQGVMGNGTIDWGIALDADGPIHSIRDLKGKKIGLASLAVGGRVLLSGYLRQNGVDPDRDVELIAVGVGAPALDALKTGRVQALMFWQAALSSFEMSGMEMRILRSPAWRALPDFTLAAMDKTVSSDPRLVEGIVRGIAKGILFLQTNPECARRIFNQSFPALRSTGPDAKAAAAKDAALIHAQMDTLASVYRLNGGAQIGRLTPGPYGALQQLLRNEGSLKDGLPDEDYLIRKPGFFDAVNAFDRQAVIASAKTCAAGRRV